MNSEPEYVSSVAWIPDASHIAVGTSTMEVQVRQSSVSFRDYKCVVFRDVKFVFLQIWTLFLKNLNFI